MNYRDPVSLSEKRASPIGSEAKDYLVQLALEEDVLRNRSTESKIILQKRRAWMRITERFNQAGYTTKKTERQLMRIWERLKHKFDEPKKKVTKAIGNMQESLSAPFPEQTEKVASSIDSGLHDVDSFHEEEDHKLPPWVSTSFMKFQMDLWKSAIAAIDLPPRAERIQSNVSPSVLFPNEAGCSIPVQCAEPDSKAEFEPLKFHFLDPSNPNSPNATVEGEAMDFDGNSNKQEELRSKGTTSGFNPCRQQVLIMAEQLEVAKLQKEAEKLRIELLKEQLKKAQIEVTALQNAPLLIEQLREQLEKAHRENDALRMEMKNRVTEKEQFF